ncbi:Transmembrane channel-like protein 3 [Trichoplax sp. H2]|nr:Transmembrane channel-like protein 3 [Trichoplax sp. H2]|eukprot:RDD44442.1 Transmembrane channel-like protein 3 [Trichoplax sp. H2]
MIIFKTLTLVLDDRYSEQERQLLTLQPGFLIKALRRPYSGNLESVEEEYIKPIFHWNSLDSNDLLLKKKELQYEIISIVKELPWPYAKKEELLELHKSYVQKQTGSTSRNSADYQYSRGLGKKLVRWLGNLLFGYKIWRERIKAIECFFGSIVASYFIFVRGVFLLNLVLSLFFVGFVVVPKLYLFNATDTTIPAAALTDDRIATVLNFQGPIRYSILFFGNYTAFPHKNIERYNLPLAYFLTTTGAYIFSYAFLLIRIAQSRKKTTKISIVTSTNFNFIWKLCTNWDFLINNEGNAISKKQSLRTEFTELLGDLRDVRESKNYGIFIKYIRRIIAWLLVIMTWLGCGTLILYTLIQYECNLKDHTNIIVRYLVSIVLALCNAISPVLFDVYSTLEDYKQQTKLKLKIFRVMIMYLFNLSVLVISIVSVTPLSNSIKLTNFFAPGEVCRLASGSQNIGKCWESTVGQELFKVSTIDLISVISGVLIGDFVRAGLVRCLPACRTKKEPPYPTFTVAQSILQIVYSQGLTCFALSPDCGPFQVYLTNTNITGNATALNLIVDKYIRSPNSGALTFIFEQITSAHVIIPVIILLCLAIAYFKSLSTNYKDLSNDLRVELYQAKDTMKRLLPYISAGVAGQATSASRSSGLVQRSSVYNRKKNQFSTPAASNPSKSEIRTVAMVEKAAQSSPESPTSSQSNVQGPKQIQQRATKVSTASPPANSEKKVQAQQPTTKSPQASQSTSEQMSPSNVADSQVVGKIAETQRVGQPIQSSRSNTPSSSGNDVVTAPTTKIKVNLNDIMRRLQDNPKSVSDQEKQELLSAMPPNKRAVVEQCLAKI